MRKVLLIVAIIVVVAIAALFIYKAKRQHDINTKYSTVEDALKEIKNPSFTIDTGGEDATPTIKTNLEQILNSDVLDSLNDGFVNSGYEDFNDYFNGN